MYDSKYNISVEEVVFSFVRVISTDRRWYRLSRCPTYREKYLFKQTSFTLKFALIGIIQRNKD